MSGIDPQRSPLLENLLLFGRVLRQAGLPVSLGQTLSFAQALDWVDLGSRRQVFHTARSLLVTRCEDLRLFESIFARFWRGRAGGEGAASRGQAAPVARLQGAQRRRLFEVLGTTARRARESDTEIEIGDRSGTYSDQEVLQQKDFSEMTPEELDAVRRLIQQMRWRVGERRTRRLVPDRRGVKIHLRRVLRDTAKLDSAPLRLWRLRRKIKQRPLVLLADISGSMKMHSRLVLQFFYCASQSLREVECFVFGTRLTRITSQLKIRNIDRALDEAAGEILDWSGGTRIGECLAVFNRRWGRRVLRRGAIVLIVSDGWERGEVSVLRREMRHLRHRCHRLIWLNPHLGQPGYQPLVEGMAAALPFVDDFLSIHNFSSLESLAEKLAALPARRRGIPAHPTRHCGNFQQQPRVTG